MSRIDQLVNELCPHGVPYVEINTLFNLRNGYTPRKSNAEYWEDGTIPWFRMEDIRDNGRILADAIQKISESAVKGGNLFPAHSLLVATSATIGEHALVEVPHLSNQRFTSLALKPQFSDQLNMKFVYYYGFILAEWCTKNTTTSSFASVDMKKFRQFKFPLPPLEVQHEIVKILDTFSQLEAELEAELETRKQQYEHYRGKLFAIDDAEFRPLGKLATNLDRRRKPVTRDARVPGAIPYYGASGIVDYVSDHIFEGDYLLVSEDGANLLARTSPIAFSISGKTWVNNHAHVLEFDTYEERRFVEFYLNSINLTEFISGATQPKLNKTNLNRIPILDPPFAEKERIVTVLDKFDSLVNDLSIGLPAEIAARRQQYEYYRDELLTFQELEVPA